MTREEAYREAERLIEVARRENAIELNLGGLRLTDLPEAIAALTQLQNLYLEENQLTELPESIAGVAT